MTGVESVSFNTLEGIALNIIIPSPILPAVRAYLLEADALKPQLHNLLLLLLLLIVCNRIRYKHLSIIYKMCNDLKRRVYNAINRH